jgi:phosphoenolpyruvate---glycerone phosphotransferase subunit DhaL
MSDHVTTAAFDAWVRRYAELIAQERDHLTELDAAIGDADHGANMDRGMKAAVVALDDTRLSGAGPLLSKVGMTLVSTIGGASGPLYGTLFLRIGATLGDVAEASPEQLAAAFRAGLDGVVARGKAVAEDKTMYDALAPAVDALEAGLKDGLTLTVALDRARQAADAGREATITMLARKGRASYLGERSVGHQDPGATSVALLVSATANTLG